MRRTQIDAPCQSVLEFSVSVLGMHARQPIQRAFFCQVVHAFMHQAGLRETAEPRDVACMVAVEDDAAVAAHLVRDETIRRARPAPAHALERLAADTCALARVVVDQYFVGFVDDVALWTRALNPT